MRDNCPEPYRRSPMQQLQLFEAGYSIDWSHFDLVRFNRAQWSAFCNAWLYLGKYISEWP